MSGARSFRIGARVDVRPEAQEDDHSRSRITYHPILQDTRTGHPPGMGSEYYLPFSVLLLSARK